jgi:serine/threonine protein phosphatase 1
VPRDAWRGKIPATHIEFMRNLALDRREGDYLFVHAGLRPGVRLDRQEEDDLLGIRQSFLASEQDFGAIVVHGHTASPTPVIRPNRIGLDTGAGCGGRLTCAMFEDDAVAFMSA